MNFKMWFFLLLIDNFFQMKTKKIFLGLLLMFTLIVFFSCKPTYKAINKVNKTIEYYSKEDYCSKIKDKYNLETSNLVFIDSVQKNTFMNYIVTEKVSYIYGIVVNGKEKIDNNFIQENKSCYSRVTNLIKNNPELDHLGASYFFIKNECSKYSAATAAQNTQSTPWASHS